MSDTILTIEGLEAWYDDAKVLHVSLPKLAPGTYRVKWRVLSVDTHVSEGEFTIDVAP